MASCDEVCRAALAKTVSRPSGVEHIRSSEGTKQKTEGEQQDGRSQH